MRGAAWLVVPRVIGFAGLVSLSALGQQTTPPAGQAVGVRPQLRVAAVNGRLRIDGLLDEPAWATPDSIANLTQIEPAEGRSPTGVTVVRVLASADALVIGIRADDAEPGRITSFARQRDDGFR